MSGQAEDILFEGPSLLPLFGREWRVQKHTRADRAELERYARDHCPQPIDRLAEALRKLADRDSATYASMANAQLPAALEAEKRWPPAFGSAEFVEFYGDPGHAAVLLWVALRRHQAATSLDEVRQLLDRAEDEGDPAAHELELLNINRRFLLGAREPLSRDDLTRRREARERADQELVGKVLAATGASGVEGLVAAIMAIGDPGSPTTSGTEPPEPSPSGTGGAPPSSPA